MWFEQEKEAKSVNAVYLHKSGILIIFLKNYLKGGEN